MSLRITSNHSFNKFQKVISSNLCSNKLQIWSVAFLEPLFALESGRRDINLDALQKKQLQFREVSYKSTYCRIGLRHFHGYFQTFYSINLPRWNPLDNEHWTAYVQKHITNFLQPLSEPTGASVSY